MRRVVQSPCLRDAVENGRADRRASLRAKLCVAGGGAGELLSSFYSEGLSGLGDARAAGNASPASMDSPRCVRIRRITAGSSIVASTIMLPPHFGQARTSASNSRRYSVSQARHSWLDSGVVALSA